MIKRELEMHRLNTRCENRVQMAAGRLCSHAFNYGGHIGTHLIVGGFDVKGPQLIECSNDGNMYSLPYHTTGSGSLAAMAILETYYKENLSQEEAVKLVVSAIEAGIYHDLGSGSCVDVCIIKKGKVEYFRNYKHDNFKIFSKPDGYKFRPERAVVLEEYRHKIVEVKGAATVAAASAVATVATKAGIVTSTVATTASAVATEATAFEFVHKTFTSRIADSNAFQRCAAC